MDKEHTFHVRGKKCTLKPNRYNSQEFSAFSYPKRKEYVRQGTSAKAEETRQRRITKIIAAL